MRFYSVFFVAIVAFLTACAETPKIDLGPDSYADKRYKSFFADGRPKSRTGPDMSQRLNDEDFTYSPLLPLYNDLTGVLDVESDKKTLWIKQFNVYWIASQKSMPPTKAGLIAGMAMGGPIGGLIGTSIETDLAKDQVRLDSEYPEFESAKCVFDASLGSKVIHVEVAMPSCPEKAISCLYSPLKVRPTAPANDEYFRKIAAEVAHLCIKEIVTRIKDIKSQQAQSLR